MPRPIASCGKGRWGANVLPAEWAERQRLSAALRDALALGAPAASEAVRTLLDPYWGFGRVRQGEALRDLLPAARTPGA